MFPGRSLVHIFRMLQIDIPGRALVVRAHAPFSQRLCKREAFLVSSTTRSRRVSPPLLRVAAFKRWKFGKGICLYEGEV